MGNSVRLAFFVALAGILVGLVAMIFAVVSKNRLTELESEFALLERFEQRLGEIESSSGSLSAGSSRMQREVESIRSGTQEALEKIGGELGRMRRDLNSAIAGTEGMRGSFRELGERLVDLETRLISLSEAPPEPVKVETAAVQKPENPPVEVKPEESEAESRISEEGQYVIRSGDTFSSIADAHGIRLGDLLEANPEVDPRRLQVGQKIRLPAR